MPPKKDTSSSNTKHHSAGKHANAKRKYVRLDEYEEDLDNQKKKFKDLEEKMAKLIEKNKKLLEGKIKSNATRIERNVSDIEDLYDNYESSYSTDDSGDERKPSFEIISGGSDFGKKLMDILQGKTG